MNKKILIIGYGEVGKAIKQIEEEAGNNVTITDKKDEVQLGFVKDIFDVTNICIPYTENFVNIVLEYVKQFPTKLIIIHSTVIPGTTEKVRKLTKIATVHSPVRGIHPNLYSGIKTFVKFVGGSSKDGPRARNHLLSLGLKVDFCGKAKSTELGKICSTTYYGWNILFAKQMSLLCKKYKVSYDTAYTRFNETYNEGYEKLGKHNVVRPILTPPDSIIGKHCVTQNFELLPRCKLKKFAKKINEEHNL